MRALFRVVLLLGVVAPPPVALGQATHGMLGDTCAGCHGTRGHSAEPMPMVAGQPQQYLAQTLKQYKTGERPSTIMGRIMRGYSDEEIDLMAAYFASEPWISPEQVVDADLAKKGESIHQSQCNFCHRDGGRYAREDVPRLAGQWRTYLEVVMEEYWKPDRKMPHLFMTVVLQRLSPADLKALAHYYASQR